ncbi:MAG: hypothetical protein RR936_15160 [Carnobacterium sp.]|uniref:hypothetical protein n=1 Tax=Carnobacterium sp. TaxID=48221 RepID=UPI002FCAF30E
MSQEKISLVDTGIYILKNKIKGENKLKPRNPLPAETIDVKKLDLATDGSYNGITDNLFDIIY